MLLAPECNHSLKDVLKSHFAGPLFWLRVASGHNGTASIPGISLLVFEGAGVLWSGCSLEGRTPKKCFPSSLSPKCHMVGIPHWGSCHLPAPGSGLWQVSVIPLFRADSQAHVTFSSFNVTSGSPCQPGPELDEVPSARPEGQHSGLSTVRDSATNLQRQTEGTKPAGHT